jgi:acyl-CoA thioester hydrolase
MVSFFSTLPGTLKEMEKRRKLVHMTTMPIRWGDMDAYGHVNNTIYFRYMEQARVEWIEAMQAPVRPGGEGAVIINASCSFLIPLNYPGTVEVRTYASHPGRSSFQTHVEMRLVGDERIYAEGAAKVVWMDTRTGKSVPLPEHVRAEVEGE